MNEKRIANRINGLDEQGHLYSMKFANVLLKLRKNSVIPSYERKIGAVTWYTPPGKKGGLLYSKHVETSHITHKTKEPAFGVNYYILSKVDFLLLIDEDGIKYKILVDEALKKVDGEYINGQFYHLGGFERQFFIYIDRFYKQLKPRT